MCGISAVIAKRNSVNLNQVMNFNNIVRHRGPDDEGYVLFDKEYTWEERFGNDSHSYYKTRIKNIQSIQDNKDYNVALGHRRLCILDLSEHGHQPMADEQNKIWLIFNGEIYNYLELKEQLINLGCHFKSNSDTEVLLYAYKVWGISCTEKFNGMWSFVIYDLNKKVIYACRDRLGVKPLYYYVDDEKILFASEIKQIFQYNNVQRKINEKIAFDYLAMGILEHEHETFFEGINKVMGGHYIKINMDATSGTFLNLEDIQYWKLKSKNENIANYNDCVDLFSKSFSNSIKMRLRSDVPVGFCLSGGLDSSSIVSMAGSLAENLTDKKSVLETFTITLKDNDKLDESKYSKQITDKYNLESNLIDLKMDDLINELKQITWYQDEPFQSLSIYAQWALMKRANEKEIRVLLDGQGGDEVLIGYERYFVFYLIDLLKKFKLIKALKEFINITNNSKLSKLQLLIYFIYFGLPGVRNVKLKIQNSSYLTLKFYNKFKKRISSIINDMKSFDIGELQSKELMHSNLPKLLRYEDKNSMAFSIESRLPFLDINLIEEMYSIDFEYKIKDGWTKSILRDSMQGILPDEIRLRKNKLGFEVSQDEWLEKNSSIVCNKIISNPVIKRFVEVEKFIKNFNKLNSNFKWRVFNFVLWIDEFEIE